MAAFAVSKYDIKHLRVFASVVEHKGVTAAAYGTGVSLSTVSRDLSALEKRLGIQLCRRGRGGFALTPQGEDVYRATVGLLARLHVFEQQIQTTRKTIGGGFNLGVIDNVISHHGAGIIDALARMHRDYPEMLINVSVHEVASIDVLVSERRIDIGMTGQPAWLQPLDYIPAFVEEHRLYVSRASPHFDAVAAAFGARPESRPELVPYIARNFRTDVFQEFEQGYPLEVAGRGGTLESVLASVQAGVGCALMPTHFVQRSRGAGLEEIACPDLPVFVQFYLAYRHDAAAQPAIRAFMERFHHNVQSDDASRILQP